MTVGDFVARSVLVLNFGNLLCILLGVKAARPSVVLTVESSQSVFDTLINA